MSQWKTLFLLFYKEGKTKHFQEEEEELCRMGGAMQGPVLCLHKDEALFGFPLQRQDAALSFFYVARYFSVCLLFALRAETSAWLLLPLIKQVQPP